MKAVRLEKRALESLKYKIRVARKEDDATADCQGAHLS